MKGCWLIQSCAKGTIDDTPPPSIISTFMGAYRQYEIKPSIILPLPNKSSFLEINAAIMKSMSYYRELPSTVPVNPTPFARLSLLRSISSP